jgi:hypothetical protein
VTTEELLRSYGFCHLNTLIVRRALYNDIGGLDENNGWEHDRDLYLRLIDRASVMKYAPFTIARHNVPDPAKGTSVTTAHSQFERHLSQLRLLDRAIFFSRHSGHSRLRAPAQGIHTEADCRITCRCRPACRRRILRARSPRCRPQRQVGRLYRLAHGEASAISLLIGRRRRPAGRFQKGALAPRFVHLTATASNQRALSDQQPRQLRDPRSD